MTKELQVFTNPAFGQVRVIERDGEPWFIAADVCNALEVNNSRQALSRLDDDEKADVILNDGSQNRRMNIINEPGLYSLVLSSRKKEAKAFKRWITHEVVPAIRKHGGYLTPEKVQEALMNPDVLIQLATQLKAEQERNKALQATAERLERDRDFLIEKRNTTTAAVMVKKRTSRTHSDFTITELAEVWELSPKRLRDVLKEEGWLMQIDGKGFHYPTLKAPQGALYIEQTSYFSKLSQTVRISPYGVQCVKQLLKDRGLLGWYM